MKIDVSIFETVPDSTGGKTFYSFSGSQNDLKIVYDILPQALKHVRDFQEWIDSHDGKTPSWSFKFVARVKNTLELKKLNLFIDNLKRKGH